MGSFLIQNLTQRELWHLSERERERERQSTDRTNSIRPLKVTETYQILRNCEPNTRSLSAQTLSERGRHFSGSVSVLPECLCVC